MKRISIIAATAFFLSATFTSCKSHTPCAGVTSKAGKVKVSSIVRPV